jgi:hypothetical protein
MLSLRHNLSHQPNLHFTERAHALANGLGVVTLAAKLVVESTVHPEKKPTEVPDIMGALKEEMVEMGIGHVYIAAFGPTGVLGPEIQDATLQVRKIDRNPSL